MAHDGYGDAVRGSLVSALVNGCLFVFKMFAGIVGNSNAMIADALDTLGDTMTSTGMIFGFMIARRPPDHSHPYGHGKAESIIAKLLSIFLIALGAKVAFSSVHSMIFHKTYIPGKIALVAAVVSIIVKLVLFQYTKMVSKKTTSTAMTVYSWNILQDAFSSLCALIGIAGARMGYYLLDPIAAFALSIFVMRAGAMGFRRAYDELMDGAPDSQVINGIRKIARQNKDVRSIKDIKVRKMGLDLMIDMTICVDKNLSVEHGHKITDLVRNDILSNVNTAKEVFIHVEPYQK